MIRISLPLLAIVVSFACSRPAAKSKLDTTSDKLREYGYVIEGKLEVPLDEKAYSTMHLVDTYTHVAESDPAAPENAETMQIINDDAAFQQHFLKGMRHGWPLNLADKIDGSKVKYWIARQLKFNENQLKEAKVSTTLRDIRKWSYKIDQTRGVVQVDYQAFVLGVRQLTIGDNLKESPIESGYEMKVPLNPVSFYFDALGAQFTNLYQKGLKNGPQAAKSDLIAQKLIESTRTSSNCLVSEDSSVISPFNSFYYFRADKGCSANKLTSLKVVNIEEIPVDTRYPEYHRLFSDKKVSFFTFYGIVDNEAEDAKEFASDLQETGYTLEPDDGSGIMKLSNTIGGVLFEIQLAVEKLAPTSREKFRESIKNSEIVVYDGHAGYGANIDDAFSTPDAYPENTYQIFVLNGCNTYKYGTTQIMHTKSVTDFDFHNMNVDVISTYESVTGHTQQRVVLKKMEEAARLLEAGNWTQQKKIDFQNSQSWLSIVTAINSDSNQGSEKDNGIFMVSGEEGNDYSPGKDSYLEAPAVSEQQMIELMTDETLDEQYRMRVMDALTNLKVQNFSGQPLADQLEGIQSFCRDMKSKNVSDVALSNSFFAPTCQIKKLQLKNQDSLQGVSLAAGQTLTFYSSGKLRRAKVASDFVKNGVQFYSGKFSFHENGQIASAQSSGALERNGLALTGPFTFFPDGSLRGGYLTKDADVAGISWKGLAAITMSESGDIRSGTLAKAAKISGIDLPAGSTLSLDEKGLIRTLTLMDNLEVAIPLSKLKLKGVTAYFREGKPIAIYSSENSHIEYDGQAMSYIWFHFNGSLAGMSPENLPQDFPYPCEVGEENILAYHRNGTFAYCKLVSKVTIKGVNFNAGDHLMIDDKGQPIGNQSRFESFASPILTESIDYLNLVESPDDIYNDFW